MKWSLGMGLLVAGCLQGVAASNDEALRSIVTNDLLRHVTVLSSDEFEWTRARRARGGMTVKYLADQLRSYGIQPGNAGRLVRAEGAVDGRDLRDCCKTEGGGPTA